MVFVDKPISSSRFLGCKIPAVARLHTGQKTTNKYTKNSP